MDRRAFIRNSTFASAAAFVPGFLRAFSPSSVRDRGNILIVIQLSGGNDGLNTVVPFRDDLYHKARPGIGLERGDCLRLNDELGFHPALEGLHEMYEQGWLSVVNHVGYPSPDRSHFRSMDIWHSGSASNEFWNHGWLGRWMDMHPHPGEPVALEINDNLGLALRGQKEKGLAMVNAEQLGKSVQYLQLPDYPGQEGMADELHFLYKTAIQTRENAIFLQEKYRKGKTSRHFPNHEFGRQMQTIARLILADSPTQIYYAELTGFDTHVNQKKVQERLLKQYGETMQAFSEEMREAGLLEQVLCLSFSEFGRRIEQNAGGGTDHGAASVVFLSGGRRAPADLKWAQPDLNHTLEGDLAMKTDFRSIYSEIINRWLGGDAEKILGHKFDEPGFLI